MKRFFFLTLLIVPIISYTAEKKADTAGTKAAAQTAPMPQMKVAYIDPMQFFSDATIVTDLKENAQKALKMHEDRYNSLQQQLRTKSQELQNSMHLLSSDARAEKERELAHLQTDLQAEEKAIKEFQYMEQQKIQMTAADDMQKNVQTVAKEAEYDIVFAGGLVYHNPDTIANLTPKVIETSNKAYKTLKNQKEQVKTLAQASNAAIKKTV